MQYSYIGDFFPGYMFITQMDFLMGISNLTDNEMYLAQRDLYSSSDNKQSKVEFESR